MANPEHVALIQQGVREWNAWRKTNPDNRPDLSGLDFDGIDLSRANLKRVDLRRADFSWLNPYHANFSRADLRRADLVGTDLQGVNLTRADLRWANLTYADLGGADLSRAKLNKAILSDTDLSEAELDGASLSKADLSGSNLSQADLSGADLTGADLTGTNLIGTNLNNAKLTGCHVYGVSVWNVNLVGAVQKNLVITPENEPAIQIDDLEVAQFMYLLLNNAKIRHVIDTITSKVVLILGRFTEERKAVLDSIREELRKRDYVPILFDFDKPESKDTHATVTTLARMAKFVIADITEPKSIPQELVSIVESLPTLAVQPILLQGGEPWGMYDHIRLYSTVLPVVRYQSSEELLGNLEQKIIRPAETKLKELMAKLHNS